MIVCKIEKVFLFHWRSLDFLLEVITINAVLVTWRCGILQSYRNREAYIFLNADHLFFINEKNIATGF